MRELRAPTWATTRVSSSIAGVLATENERLFDNDLIGGADLVARENDNRGLSYSLEGRYEASNDRFDWVVGALWAHDLQEQKTRVRVGESADTPIEGVSLFPPSFVFPPGLCLQCTDKEFELESAALFGDLTWRATERLDLTVGGRYTRELRSRPRSSTRPRSGRIRSSGSRSSTPSGRTLRTPRRSTTSRPA